jgi:multicomponent Na+:H+ antiporter subunit F
MSADFCVGMAGFLLVNLLVGLLRIYRGPTRADRLLAAQLFTTITAGVLVLLAVGENKPALLNVALLFTLLAALACLAFVRLPSRHPEDAKEDE